MLAEDLPPSLYHVADARGWPSIQQHGLLTTASILRRWEIDSNIAEAALTQIRHEPLGPLEHVDMGTAWIRDQNKMTEKGLSKALSDGTNVADWCTMLNRQVFLFPNRAAAEKLLDAYRPHPQVIIALRTASLVEAYGTLLRLTRINTGSTTRAPAGRGEHSFFRVGFYHGLPSGIREVVIRSDIGDLDDHVTAIWMSEVDGSLRRTA